MAIERLTAIKLDQRGSRWWVTFEAPHSATPFVATEYSRLMSKWLNANVEKGDSQYPNWGFWPYCISFIYEADAMICYVAWR